MKGVCIMFEFDLQLFGGVFSGLFGGGESRAAAVAAPSVKTSAPGSVATTTAEDNGSRLEVQRRLRRGLNTDKTQGALAADAVGTIKKTLLGA